MHLVVSKTWLLLGKRQVLALILPILTLLLYLIKDL